MIEPIVIRLTFLLFGFALLPLIERLDQRVLQQVFGILLIVIICVQMFANIEPREHLHRGWGWLSFGSSGAMQGAIGIGGPPLVLWLMAKKWTHEKNRAFMFSLFLVSSFPHYILMYVRYGEKIVQPTIVGIAAIPLILAGTAGGIWLGNRLDQKWVRGLTYGLLLFLVANMILDPFQIQQSSAN